MTMKTTSISIVVPVFNEEWAIHPFYGKLERALAGYEDCEVIFVDDGSTDRTIDRLLDLSRGHLSLKVIKLRRNFGVTHALQAGIDHARGDCIVTISGNLQDEPAEIPKLLKLIDEGFDVVVGWSQSEDGELTRESTSGFSSWLISKISGVQLHDYNCLLRAYRSELLKGLQLYANLERYIPVYIFWKGGTIAETPVLQHPRSHGKRARVSKTKRTLKTILDLFMLKFLEKFSDRPLYIFGALSLGSFAFGLLSLSWMIWLKIFQGKAFIETPLPLVTVLFILTGVLLMVLGVMAEFLARVYLSGRNEPIYAIAQISEPEAK
jgi:glycosyltransferase involved in cell wall biosynthesis